MDKRVLRRWAAARPRTPLRYVGVDEIYLGRRDKFLTVASDLESGEPLWAGRDRKRETLDRFFVEALPVARRRVVRAVCVDMWEPFAQRLRVHLPHARIVYDKFHVLRHVNQALDETRRAEFFRHGGDARAILRGKRWLLLRSWGNLERAERQQLGELLALNRRLAKAYLLKEQLAHLWDYTYEGAAWRFLTTWVRALRWQRLPAFDKIAQLLSRHLDGLLPRQASLRESRGDQRQHPRDAPPGPRVSRSRVPAPQSSEGDRRAAPAAENRMNIEPITDSGVERI
jgi:transposase